MADYSTPHYAKSLAHPGLFGPSGIHGWMPTGFPGRTCCAVIGADDAFEIHILPPLDWRLLRNKYTGRTLFHRIECSRARHAISDALVRNRRVYKPFRSLLV
jgi:hypothetical protein